MHELPITESILKIVLNHAQLNNASQVLTVNLQIGKLSDIEDEWIQRYFDYLSKDTIAAGAKLKIERMPAMVQCNACSHTYEADIQKMGNLTCPACGQTKGTLISGREYHIKDMEIQ
jgi:hydrogenase nickel incorporation protein HypA/HybF